MKQSLISSIIPTVVELSLAEVSITPARFNLFAKARASLNFTSLLDSSLITISSFVPTRTTFLGGPEQLTSSCFTPELQV